MSYDTVLLISASNYEDLKRAGNIEAQSSDGSMYLMKLDYIEVPSTSQISLLEQKLAAAGVPLLPGVNGYVQVEGTSMYIGWRKEGVVTGQAGFTTIIIGIVIAVIIQTLIGGLIWMLLPQSIKDMINAVISMMVLVPVMMLMMNMMKDEPGQKKQISKQSQAGYESGYQRGYEYQYPYPYMRPEYEI